MTSLIAHLRFMREEAHRDYNAPLGENTSGTMSTYLATLDNAAPALLDQLDAAEKLREQVRQDVGNFVAVQSIFKSKPTEKFRYELAGEWAERCRAALAAYDAVVKKPRLSDG